MKIVKGSVYVAAIGVNVLFLYGNGIVTVPYMLATVLCYVFADAVQMAVHETGHLIGGLASGYELVYFQLGPVYLARTGGGRLRLRFRLDRGGQCAMAPERTQPVHYHRYNLGGVVLNAALTVPCVWLLFSPVMLWKLAGLELIIAGVIKIIANCVPKRGPVPNDCGVVMLLKENTALQKDYVMYLRLYAQLYWGRTVDMDMYRYPRTLQGKHDSLVYYQEMQKLLDETGQAVN